MREHSLFERIAIAMGAGGKEDRNGFRRERVGARRKRNLHSFAPFGKSSRDFRLGGIGGKLRAIVLKGIEQSRAPQARTVPAVSNSRDRLRDGAGGSLGAGAGIDSSASDQCSGSRKDVLH